MDKRTRLNSVVVEGEVFAETETAITLAADSALFEIYKDDIVHTYERSEEQPNLRKLLISRDAKIIYHSLVDPTEMDGVLSGRAIVEYVQMSDCSTECSRCAGGTECSRCNASNSEKFADCSTECSRCAGGTECSRCNASNAERFADCSTECSRCAGGTECSRCTSNRMGYAQIEGGGFRRRLS